MNNNIIFHSLEASFNTSVYPTIPSNWSSCCPESPAAIAEVGHQILYLFLGEAVLGFTCFILVIFAFPAAPEFPPSVAQQKKRELAKSESKKPLKENLVEFCKNILRGWLNQILRRRYIAFSENSICFFDLLTPKKK